MCTYLPTSCDIRTWAAVDPLPMMVVGAEVPQPCPNHKDHSIPFSIAKVTVTISYNLMRYVAAIQGQWINDTK